MSYFIEKDQHSEIKHKIYSDTLQASLSIANIFNKQKSTYLLLDLYAGKGKFDDGSHGSPIVALETFQKAHKKIDNMPVHFVFIEKDEDSNEHLKQALTEYNQAQNLPNDIEIIVGKGEWGEFETNLQNKIAQSNWGFVFADPFANEIDISKFSELLTDSYTKDVMIFINLIAIKRQAGHQQASKKIAAFLRISEAELKQLLNNQATKKEFLEYIKKAFSFSKKHFNLFAAIPTSRKNNGTNNLIHGDYFCLSCSTNSIGVANAFLESYADALSINKDIQTGLFGAYEIETRINNYLQKEGEKSFHEIMGHAMEEFLSWKEKLPNEVPTSENTLKIINQMLDDKIIEIECPDEYLSKTKKLKTEAIRKNENLKKIRIKLRQKDPVEAV